MEDAAHSPTKEPFRHAFLRPTILKEEMPEAQAVAFTKPGYPIQDVLHWVTKPTAAVAEDQVLVEVKAAALK